MLKITSFILFRMILNKKHFEAGSLRTPPPIYFTWSLYRNYHLHIYYDSKVKNYRLYKKENLQYLDYLVRYYWRFKIGWNSLFASV